MAARNRFLALAPTPLLALGLLALATGCSSVRYKETNRTFDTVVIDAGHGAHDPGASKHGIVEKHAALDVSRRLETKLRAAGFRTVMTRDRDVFIPLAKRARIANAQSNAVFVSVHFNYAHGRQHRGAETYYYSKHSRALATALQREIARVAPPGRGVKKARFKVLRLSQYPAALAECGFVTNPGEARKISSPGHRERIALALSNGIIRHRWPGGRPATAPKPPETSPPTPSTSPAPSPKPQPAPPPAP